ncbi:hypothetical protein CF651_15845 [Paenibacillus rigui]|uniref:Uncharacterized protein n=1 Tax=Paenibacillus rigui TaxID=554312 RepID=A0A229UP08_9BACL|nr:hypothetical protein CF651_15845 [Paenibacillus rigui]
MLKPFILVLMHFWMAFLFKGKESKGHPLAWVIFLAFSLKNPGESGAKRADRSVEATAIGKTNCPRIGP